MSRGSRGVRTCLRAIIRFSGAPTSFGPPASVFSFPRNGGRGTMPASATSSRSGKSSRKAVKITRTRKPAGMSLEDWQVALRREFGRQQKFRLVNVGQSEIFSDFNVTNPQSGRTYRVSICGGGVGENRCTCPDFAVNTLGTCKHIEFALSRLERRVGGTRAAGRGSRPAFSEVYLRFGARRAGALGRGDPLPPD